MLKICGLLKREIFLGRYFSVWRENVVGIFQIWQDQSQIFMISSKLEKKGCSVPKVEREKSHDLSNPGSIFFFCSKGHGRALQGPRALQTLLPAQSDHLGPKFLKNKNSSKISKWLHVFGYIAFYSSSNSVSHLLLAQIRKAEHLKIPTRSCGNQRWLFSDLLPNSENAENWTLQKIVGNTKSFSIGKFFTCFDKVNVI